MSKSVVRTRMAPSPTGEMHVGSLSILLKNYAYAKKHHGQFILRIEDTDQAREVEGSVEQILDVLKIFGLLPDEGPTKGGEYGPYTQSQRLDIYRKHAGELVANDKAYHCFCSRERLEEVRAQKRADHLPPKYDRHCRSLTPEEVKTKLEAGKENVIRLKVPDDKKVKFNDLIRGEIEFDSNQVDDQVLLKSDGFPTYHLAVVIDDHLMKISHVMRGEEWISSTPKHVLLYQAFDWPLPVYAHIPIYLNPDGKGKMSKRKGTVSVQSFLDKGYLPQTLLNFFMILGWATEDEREIMTLDEYIAEFDPKDISHKSVVFDLKKLQWLNGMYIRQLEDGELTKLLQPFLPEDYPADLLPKVLPLIKERLVLLSDITHLTTFFYQPISQDQAGLTKKSSAEEVISQLEKTILALAPLENDWSTTKIEIAIRKLQEENDWHKRQYFMMVRVASTGDSQTPPLFETMELIGYYAINKRLKQAQEILQTT